MMIYFLVWEICQKKQPISVLDQIQFDNVRMHKFLIYLENLYMKIYVIFIRIHF